MSAISFQTTVKGDLTDLSFILRKPEPLGAYLNKVACSLTGGLLFMEVQRGKFGMDNIKYQQQI